jgi:hypothetical protein
MMTTYRQAPRNFFEARVKSDGIIPIFLASRVTRACDARAPRNYFRDFVFASSHERP